MPRNLNPAEWEWIILEAMDKALIPRGSVDPAVVECFARLEKTPLHFVTFSRWIALCTEAAEWMLEASKHDVATLLWAYGYWNGMPDDEVTDVIFEWEHEILETLAEC